MEFFQKFLLNPEFAVEKFDTEILLYAMSNTTGVYLNETAYLVWQLCAQEQTGEEIIDLLEERYPLQKATIRKDVCAALTSFVECGALIDSSD